MSRITQIIQWKKARYLAIAAVFLVFNGSVNGVVVVRDHFAYPNGNLAGNNGGDSLNPTNQWSGAWTVGATGAAGDFTVEGGRVETPGPVPGVAYTVRPFTESLGLGTYYFGYSFRIPTGPENPFYAGMGITSGNQFNSSTDEAQLYTQYTGSSIFLRGKIGAAGSVQGAFALSPGTEYRIIGKIAYGPGSADTLTAWVAPLGSSMLESDTPYLVNTSASDVGSTLGNDFVTLYRESVDSTVLQYREFILATTFNEAVPEPTSITLFGLAAVVAMRMRRK